MTERRKTKQVNIRNVAIGSGNRIAVQSMTNVPVEQIDETLGQIERLTAAGCDIVRVAVPNSRAVSAFADLRKLTDVPLVADVHFDYRLAIGAIEAGADKLRINPGNIALRDLDKVIDCAKKHKVAIRIGVNGGSVGKEYVARCGGDKSLALVESVKDYVKYFENRGFDDIVLSVKSSDVASTVYLNRQIADLGYPLHLGVTEAGLAEQGKLKNAIGIGSLLLDGIGDTLRVSLTADPVEEVNAAKDILSVLGLRNCVTFVSCPKCGRCSVDLERVAGEVYGYVRNLDCNLKIAVMGCEVNGPGECKDADIGIAGSNGRFVFFKKGRIYKYVEADVAVKEFIREIDLLCKG